MARSQISILPLCLLMLGVLCEDWKATMPESLQALNGSCVRIPCSFTLGSLNSKDFNPLLNENCNGIWKKNNKEGPTVFSSDISSESHTKGTMTRNVAQRDCTTILHNFQMDDSGQYFFRIECGNALKWTFSQSVKITAQETPFEPILSPRIIRVEEGNTVSVNVTCSAVAPCPTLLPTLTWTPRLNDSKEEQEYADQTKIMTSTFTFTASHHHHGQMISCTADYQRQDNQMVSSESWLTLSVNFAPKVTSVSVSPCGPLQMGSSVTLTCSSDANPAVSYTWYRVDGGRVTPVGFEPKTTVKVSADKKHFYCMASNELGAKNSSVQALDIVLPPTNTLVSMSPPGPVLEGMSVTMMCSSDAGPDISYTWFKVNGGEKTVVGSKSVFTITETNRRNSGQYTCETQNKHGVDNSKFATLDVHFAPEIRSSSQCVKSGVLTNCICETHGNPYPRLHWQLAGHPVTQSDGIVIREEAMDTSGLKSFVTMSQSQTSSSLVCLSTNSAGSTSLEIPQPHLWDGLGNYPYLMMLMVVISALVILYIFTVGICLFRIKQIAKRPLKTVGEGDTDTTLPLTTEIPEYDIPPVNKVTSQTN